MQRCDENTLKLFFDSAPMMMGIAQLESGDIRHVADNQASATFFRQSVEALRGKFASELGVAPSEIKLWIEQYRIAEATHEPVRFEYKHAGTAGTRWLSVTVNLIGRSSEGHSQFSYIAQDITELREAQLQLEERVKQRTAELQLKSDALENSLNGFDIVNAKGELVYANRMYLKMWGYDSLDEIIGASPADHCADPNVPLKIITELKAKGECNIEFVAKRKDGSTFDVVMWARLAHDADGNEIYPTTSIDITEIKKAELQLRESERRLETVANNAASCLFMMDKQGRPTFMNPAAMEVTGYKSLDEIKDRPLHYAVHWKRPDGTPYPMEECPIDNAQAELRPVQNREEIFCRKDGSLFPVSFSVAPLEENGETIGSVLEFRDITEQKRIEAELRDAIRARDEFLSVASHELKTPLSSLKLQAQLAKRVRDRGDPSVYQPEKVNKLIEQTDRQTTRLTRLVDDMLDIARIRSGKLTVQRETFNVCGLIDDIIDRLGPNLVEAGTQITFNCPGPVEVTWDRFRIEQVITNLLTNAMRYGSRKPVSITVERSLKGHECVRIIVRDQGIGLSESSKDRIFDRFERAVAASEVSGLGLGLFITRQIVRSHGGEIWAESAGPQQGATFVVEIPALLSEKATRA